MILLSLNVSTAFRTWVVSKMLVEVCVTALWKIICKQHCITELEFTEILKWCIYGLHFIGNMKNWPVTT